MADLPTPEAKTRRRWISFGEAIALAALIVSALGLWNSWRGNEPEKPVPSAEAKAIPIAFRGNVEADGKAMIIAPIEGSHSLQALTLTVGGKQPLSIDSDGRLLASDIQSLISEEAKGGPGSVTARIEARYIEAGKLKRGGGRYRISYRWDHGGLFGGDRLRLNGLSIG